MKYKLNDTIFYMNGNKVVSNKVVTRMQVDTLDNTTGPDVSNYNALFGRTRVLYGTVLGEVNEEKCFLTKEELLASL